MRQVRAILHEQLDPRRHGVLLVHGQAMPPLSELVGVLNSQDMIRLYSYQGIVCNISAPLSQLDQTRQAGEIPSNTKMSAVVAVQARNRNQGGYESN